MTDGAKVKKKIPKKYLDKLLQYWKYLIKYKFQFQMQVFALGS